LFIDEKYPLSDDYLELIKDELNIKEIVKKAMEESEATVSLDTVITGDLKLEGMVRDLVRTINQLRKEAGLTINDTISIGYQTASEEISAAIEKHLIDLKKDTLSTTWSSGSLADGVNSEIKIDGQIITLSIIKN
jgi:isoleucyl-tRNA synthetase